MECGYVKPPSTFSLEGGGGTKVIGPAKLACYIEALCVGAGALPYQESAGDTSEPRWNVVEGSDSTANPKPRTLNPVRVVTG